MPKLTNLFDGKAIAGDSNMARDMILLLQDGYKKRKVEDNLYNEEDSVPEIIIMLYLTMIEKCNIQVIMEDFKRKFIYNEAIVEPGVTAEEKRGLGLIYDYIKNYDFANKTPNIFVESLKLHSILYSQCPHPEFGGKIRNEPVILNDLPYEVPSADEAKARFQAYISKKLDIDYNAIFDYIDTAIEYAVDLISIQPFPDGNKRTFRALLNLLFAKIGLPPVYIKKSERELYKQELIKAIYGDFKGIKRFYHYKISDSIVELDILRVTDELVEDGKKFIIQPTEKKEKN